MSRIATIKRSTTETDVTINLNIDGSGVAKISTSIGFLDHMLHLFTRHGLFDAEIFATGDTHIDDHHTVEDIGICIGQAFRHAIGDGAGIRRFSSGLIPMDDALVEIAIDVSNRIHISFSGLTEKSKIGTFDTELIEEFLTAFVNNARITLHVTVRSGNNLHHISEAIFKGLGVILADALSIDIKKQNAVPSTKGSL